jgi:hypothetical protein
MLTYLIVSGLCLQLLLHIIGKFWQSVLEMHSAADKFDGARDLAARGQQATIDSEHDAHGQIGSNSHPPKYCHVW